MENKETMVVVAESQTLWDCRPPFDPRGFKTFLYREKESLASRKSKVVLVNDIFYRDGLGLDRRNDLNRRV